MQTTQFRLSPNTIQAPAAGGRFVLRVDSPATRRGVWRSVVTANNGVRIRTEDNPAESTLTVIVEPSVVQSRVEARVALQVRDVTGTGGWIYVGAEAIIMQAPAAALQHQPQPLATASFAIPRPATRGGYNDNTWMRY